MRAVSVFRDAFLHSLGRKPPLGTLRGKAQPERRESATTGRMRGAHASGGEPSQLSFALAGCLTPDAPKWEVAGEVGWDCFLRLSGVWISETAGYAQNSRGSCREKG